MERGEMGHDPDYEKDCPCGRYPNGDCQLCLTAQAKTRYEEGIKKQREAFGEEPKPEQPKPKPGEASEEFRKNFWKSMRDKYGKK